MTAVPSFIIADNQDITRAGLRHYIFQSIKGVHMDEADCKRDLIEAMDKWRDGVVVLDYTLFDLKGVEEFMILHHRFPQINWILFSTELSEDFIRRVSVECNVSIILKDNSSEEICTALKCAGRGERFLCHQISNLLLLSAPGGGGSKDLLTPSEREILRLIAKGLSVKEIAGFRNSSNHTIIAHKKNIFRKLGVNNVYEATKYAIRAGLVELMEYYI